MPDETTNPGAPAAEKAESSNKSAKIWEWAYKIMSLLVIPLVLWGVRLEVRLAVMNTERVNLEAQTKADKADLQVKIDKLEAALEKGLAAAGATSKAVEKGMQDNKVTLGRMEGKLDGIDKDIDEIKGLLRNIR